MHLPFPTGRSLCRAVRSLLLIQPLLDVLSYLCPSPIITLSLRLGALLFLVAVGYTSGCYQRLYRLLALFCVLFYGAHFYTICRAGLQNPLTDLTNTVRVFQLPWSTLALISCVSADPNCKHAIRTAMTVNLFVILGILLLSLFTNSDPHTYEDGTGILGWFSNTNSQSAILCMIVPVAAVQLTQQHGIRSFRFHIGVAGGFLALFLLGTRLAFFGMAVSGIAIGVVLLLSDRRKKPEAFYLLGLTVLLLSLTPVSPMMQHQKSYAHVQSHRQAQINTSLSNLDLPPLDENRLSEDELAQRQAVWIDALTPIYTLYAPDFISCFGAARTIDLCGYSTEIGDITEQRPKKRMFARLLLEDSPPSARWFGLELDRFHVGAYNYDVENDFHGIFYLYGIVGLTALVSILLFIFLRTAAAFTKSPAAFFSAEWAAWAVAVGTCLLHAYFTAGVLRRPNASIYLAACLSAIYADIQTTPQTG